MWYTTSKASTRSKSHLIKFTSSASPHLGGATWTIPSFVAKMAVFASALNWRFVMTCGRSVIVTLASRVAATAIPTRLVPDPSSRILRLRCWLRSVEDKGLLLGSQRWWSKRVTRVVATGQNWNERPCDGSYLITTVTKAWIDKNWKLEDWIDKTES